MTALDKFYNQIVEWYGTNPQVDDLYDECKKSDIGIPAITTGVDTRAYVLIKNGTPIKAAKKVVELAGYLQDNKHRVVPHEELLSKVWGRSEFISKTTVLVHVCKIRSILGDNCIKSAKSVGYQWNIK